MIPITRPIATSSDLLLPRHADPRHDRAKPSPRYETSLQEERSHLDPDRFSTTSSNRIPRGPPKRVESEKVCFLIGPQTGGASESRSHLCFYMSRKMRMSNSLSVVGARGHSRSKCRCAFFSTLSEVSNKDPSTELRGRSTKNEKQASLGRRQYFMTASPIPSFIRTYLLAMQAELPKVSVREIQVKQVDRNIAHLRANQEIVSVAGSGGG